MAGDEDLTRELAALRAELAALHAAVHVNRLRHGWLRYVVSDLETNPKTQYKVHLYGVVYWLLNFPAVTLLFFLEPGLWLKLGIFITLIYSIYANFATDYGGMSAAMAIGDRPLPPVPLEPPVEPG
jgi:hypothetical protein